MGTTVEPQYSVVRTRDGVITGCIDVVHEDGKWSAMEFSWPHDRTYPAERTRARYSSSFDTREALLIALRDKTITWQDWEDIDGDPTMLKPPPGAQGFGP